MNSKTSVMPFARFQSTADGSKPKPRSTNNSTRSLRVSKSSYVTIMVVPKADQSKSSSSFLYSKHFVCSTCHKCIFNENHDACITKIPKEVNSRAKIRSHKTRNINKPVDQKSHTQKKPVESIYGLEFSNMLVLRWIPTGSLLASCYKLRRSEPTLGSNVDIPNTHESKQTLDLSAAVTTADASDKRQQQPDSTSSTSTLATTVTADGNFD
ncbi:hypothetical protein Tco_1537118, partial [Tanacetum coccineum]